MPPHRRSASTRPAPSAPSSGSESALSPPEPAAIVRSRLTRRCHGLRSINDAMQQCHSTCRLDFTNRQSNAIHSCDTEDGGEYVKSAGITERVTKEQHPPAFVAQARPRPLPLSPLHLPSISPLSPISGPQSTELDPHAFPYSTPAHPRPRRAEPQVRRPQRRERRVRLHGGLVDAAPERLARLSPCNAVATGPLAPMACTSPRPLSSQTGERAAPRCHDRRGRNGRGAAWRIAGRLLRLQRR